MPISLFFVLKALVCFHFFYILFKDVICTFYKHYIVPWFQRSLDFRLYTGKWAAITGSTDGIGKAFVEQLAAYGINIILISRTQEKLEALASFIENEYHVKTKIITVDFSNEPEIVTPIISNGLDGVEIDILVNCVGEFYRYPQRLTQHPNSDELVKKLINTNMFSCTIMTRLILPGMVDRKRGVIINISSISAYLPTPLIAIYSASKRYMAELNRNLYAEYKDQGIHILTTSPAYVATKLAKIEKPTFFVPSAKYFTERVLEQVGTKGKIYGPLIFDLMNASCKLLCILGAKFVLVNILGIFFRKLRRKYLQNKMKYSKMSYQEAFQ